MPLEWQLLATTGNNYLNSRTQGGKAYLAFWNDAKAIGQCSGSAFVFTGLDELANTIQSTVDTWTPYIGKLFGHTQDAINTVSATKTDSYSSIDEFLASYNKMTKAISTFNSSSRIMPTVGKKYALKNAHSNNYVQMPISFGSDLTNTNTRSRNACWILEQGSSDGAYMFRNTVTNYYISTDNFDPGTSAFEYSFRPSNSVAGATAIGNGDDANAHKFLHMNPSPAIGWTADAGASQWRFEEITDDAYNALPAIDESTMDFIALKAQLYNTKLPKVTGTDVSDAQTAFTSSKTLENAKAYMTAVENNQYVRIISVSPFKDLQVENGTPVSNGVNEDNTIPTVWRLEFVDPANNDFRMKLRHMNTGKYLGAIYNSVGMSDDFTNGATFTITSTDDDKFYIADGNGTKMCYTSTGSLTNSGSNNKWYMDFAKQTQIPLTTVGDKSYATVYLPFAVSAVSGASAYIGTLNDEHNYIDFTDVTSGFAANEGVVLEGEAATDAKAVLTIGGNAEKKNNCFTGSCTPVSVAEADRNNYRVLGVSTTDESRIAFFKPSAQLTTIGANRAFILNTAIPSVLNVRYGQMVEGIGQVTTAPATDNADAPVYDLTGRRVQKAVKGGVYIQNGKKFIVK